MTKIITNTGNESIPGAIRSSSFSVLSGGRIITHEHPSSISPRTSAGRGLQPAIAGTWINAVSEVADDTELLVVAQAYPGGHAISKRIRIKVDVRAPLHRLSMANSGHERSTGRGSIEGHFWVIDPKEAVRSVDTAYPSRAASYLDPYTLFNPLEVLMAGQALPVVETKTINFEGADHQIATHKRKRALRL